MDEKTEQSTSDSGSADGTVVEVEAILEEIVPDFLSELEDDVEQMKAHHRDREFERIQEIAHDVKGSGAGYGFDRVTDLGRTIEEAARQEAADRAREAIETLESYLANVEVTYVE